MEISFICSLGNMCHSACIMQKLNIKLESYPFDWIFSNFNIITHCLEDNFATFLNKKYYIDIPKIKSNKMCGHAFYQNNMFWHKNPRIKNDYDYYLRCVNRFRNLLKREENKLFIIINSNNNSILNNETKKSVDDFNLKLSNFTKNYTILYIYHIPNNSYQSYNFVKNDNIDFLELFTISKSNGKNFINNSDDAYLNEIIKEKYNFNIK